MRSVWSLGIVFALGGPAVGRGAEAAGIEGQRERRFLVTEDGTPFFWLGDTAWELFHRLDSRGGGALPGQPRQAGLHRDPGRRDRRARRPHRPQPLRPPAAGRPRPGPAGRQGRPGQRLLGPRRLHRRPGQRQGPDVGFLPTWGRYWHDKVKDGKPLFTRENAAAYGEWLGRRYKDKGDRSGSSAATAGVDNDEQKEIIRAMARGLRKGDGGAHLITFHPHGGGGLVGVVPRRRLARLQHAAERPRRRVHRPLRADPRRLRPHARQARASTASRSTRTTRSRSTPRSSATRSPPTCARPLYWDLFGGACGHTYGHHSVWQMWTPGAGADQRPADALDRGDRPARRGADAARPPAARVAAVPDPRSPTTRSS